MTYRTYRGVRSFVAAVLLLGGTTAHANLTLNTTVGLEGIRSTLEGPGLRLTNITLTKGSDGQYGLFAGGLNTSSSAPNLGMANGLFMSTGNTYSVLGPNNKKDYTFSTNTRYSDPNLISLDSNAEYDPVIIEFDLVPEGDKVNFVLVFGSDEYPEYVCSKYNDVFGLFVSGPGFSSTQNAAYLPNSQDAIAVNNVNGGVAGSAATGALCKLTNSKYFLDNGNGTGNIGTQLDGFTKPITASLSGLQANQTYHVKLALADTGDAAYDSAAFFRWLTSTVSDLVDLELTAVASPAKPEKDGLVTLTYTLKNLSSRSTRLVRVGIEWPEGMTIQSSNAGSAFNTTTGEWLVGDVAANSSKTLTIQAKVGSAAQYQIPAEITYAFNDDPNSTPFNRHSNPNENDTALLTLATISNTAPRIDTAAGAITHQLGFPENSSNAVIDYAGSDNEGETEGNGLVWSIAGGADAALFSMNAQGLVAFNTPPNFEQPTDQNKDNVYELVVQLCDSYKACVQQTLKVQVTDVGEDADGDGINDDVEIDLGLNPNDVDSDKDGIPDNIELGDATKPRDTDGDGKIDPLDTDDDNDGILTKQELGKNPSQPQDSDGDKVPDYLDTDDDGDGKPTTQEAPDLNGDGVPDDSRDTDSNGIPDYLDTDDDGDGKPTRTELGSNPASPPDSDGDGIPDYLDNKDNDGSQGDSDGDGIPNGDEIVLGLDPNNADTDRDGIPDGTEVGPDLKNPRDSDGDGIIDPLDVDDDEDGILTRFELGFEQGKPQDTDGDGKPDYLDTDDDNDTILTKHERPDLNGDRSPGDAQDTDRDGFADYIDPDDDNDKLLTKDEQPDPNKNGQPEDAVDSDLDGIPDYLDATVTPYVKIKVKAFLQGPYNSSNGLMGDQLRQAGYLPRKQPYSSVSDSTGYTSSSDLARPFGYTGTEVLMDDIYNREGDSAIVDWVLLEIREAANPAKRLAMRAGVIQRNGRVIDAQTGSDEFALHNVTPGNYYVVIDHRNHLGVMTAQPVKLDKIATLWDFTDPAVPTHGEHSRVLSKSVALMIAGDVNNTNSISASGGGSDTNVINGVILLMPNNGGTNASYVLRGYYSTDVNLDGLTLYAGNNNDVNLIMVYSMMHPANTNYSTTYVIQGLVPKYEP